METWVQIMITAVVSVVASSGFWAFLQHRAEKKDAKNDLLLALARDRIIHLGLSYLHKGWLESEELEDLDGLFGSYSAAGGNGTAKKIYEDVKRLPMEPPDEEEE